MRTPLSLVLAASSVCTSIAAASRHVEAMTPRQTSTEPCTIVQSLIADDEDIPAEVALACLQTVPTDTETDIELIDEYKVFVEWQSTLAYLKDPPEGYNEPAIDIMGVLDTIKTKLQNNDYTNEYDVHDDIRKIAHSVHDTHFGYRADILGIFQFRRPVSLLSLSEDGFKTPKVYAVENGTLLQPEITRINDQDVVDFLNEVASTGSLLDADARYNELFSSSPSPSFSGQSHYTGPWTNLTLADGTELTGQNIASVSESSFSWRDVSDGPSLFQACCSGAPSNEIFKRSRPVTHIKRQESLSQKRQDSSTGLVFSSDDTPLSGFYLDGSDVAVISIPSFDGDDVDTDVFTAQFQGEMINFLKTAKASGRNKILIDLRGNGGGVGVLGWDTFRAFFPNTEPADVTRFRANENYLLVGEGVKAVLGNAALQDESPRAYALIESLRDWNWQAQLKPDGSHYPDADSLYGPAEVNGDKFTNLIRRDLSNPLSYGSNVDIIGYNSQQDAIEQLYQSNDIVLLHDGACGSTCAAFAEFMKNAGRVRSVVVGGRPSTGPMQGVAGTKGGFTFQYPTIQSFANDTISALEILNPDEAERLKQTSLGKLQADLGRPDYVLNKRQVTAAFNCEDNIQSSDKDMVPLQFVYEAADCRLFYTQEGVADPSVLWKMAADAMWSGGSCVADSQNHPSSISGGDSFDPDGDSNEGSNNGDENAASLFGWESSKGVLIAGTIMALLFNIL